MPESQNIEYKSSWRDEYLKWICGFANASGGSIFIGKDDAGNVVGLTDAKKLLEEIPNKVRDTLGILSDVNLHTTAQGDFIEIIVEDINRIEKYEYPRDAVREALLNAIAHKDYSGGTPIQISVYSDRIIFWNEGQLPENWTIENLLTKHPSKAYNPDIANALFRSGYIESWGRGTLKMIRECELAGLPKPIYFYDMSGFFVEFRKDNYNEQYLSGLGLNQRQVKAMMYVREKEAITNGEYQKMNGIGKTFATKELQNLVEKNILKNAGLKGRGSKYIMAH